MTEDQLERADFQTASLPWARGPRMREMTSREMAVVLQRNHIGRIAYQGDGRVELVPVHYVYVDGAIVGRTSIGSKYLAWLTRDQVVFEVDEADGLFDWRSVVARGVVRILTPLASSEERDAYGAAVSALRRLIPGAFTELDPTPHRPVIFVIAPSSMTGRSAFTRASGKSM